MGHQDAFLWPRLGARYLFSQGTLAGAWGNGRDVLKVRRIPPPLASEMTVTLTSGG
jgi:hypothetical protein